MLQYTPSEVREELKTQIKTKTSVGQIATDAQLEEVITSVFENPEEDMFTEACILLVNHVISSMPPESFSQ